jgi:hypothetical protein
MEDRTAFASYRPADPDYDEWREYEVRRGHHRSSLLMEDGVILLGILLGGVAGYLGAEAMRSSNSRHARTRSLGVGPGSEADRRWSRFRTGRPSVEHDETTDLIASSKVEGTTVYNRKGEKLGDVHNFMVGKRSGQVAYAVMSFGGILGLGQTYHALPWSALTYDENKGGYVVDADKERITAAPSFKAGEEPFSRPGYGRDVRGYWSPSVG